MATHPSILARRVPRTEEPSRLQFIGSHSVGRDWAANIHDIRYVCACVDICISSQMLIVVKNPPANAGDVGDGHLIPGLGRSPGGGHGNPPQYSCLRNTHGQGSLVGYSPWGRKESDMAEQLSTAQHINNYLKCKWIKCPNQKT